MLHITNGDSVAHTLRDARLPGSVSISADVLHEGPCPTAATAAEFRETRARYLADGGYAPYDDILEALVEQDAALHAARGEDEVVLWFEHDLFDQLHLVRLLDWFFRYGVDPPALSLICIGEHPGVDRFYGLGQLTVDQLRALFPARRPVTAAQLALGADAWRRFGADDPRAFAALLEQDTHALPFLEGAVRRQLQELPSTRNGLSRMEHQALAAIAAGAPDILSAFRSTQEMEERVFLGDRPFVRAIRALASAGLPPVELDPPGDHVPFARQSVSLTPFGRQVLAGHADHARMNGIDRWIGGTHLLGRNPAWRWDTEREVMWGQDD